MSLTRLQTLAVAALFFVLAETAFAQNSRFSTHALSAAARSSIRAQILANWSSARTVNQVIMNAAKAGPATTSMLRDVIANINATKAKNKEIRSLPSSRLQANILSVPETRNSQLATVSAPVTFPSARSIRRAAIAVPKGK